MQWVRVGRVSKARFEGATVGKWGCGGEYVKVSDIPQHWFLRRRFVLLLLCFWFLCSGGSILRGRVFSVARHLVAALPQGGGGGGTEINRKWCEQGGHIGRGLARCLGSSLDS